VHDSKLIAIVGHYDCAGNPADKETQLRHILSSIITIESWEFEVQIIGLWVDKNWRVATIDR
jgi:carbonic anhydrase